MILGIPANLMLLESSARMLIADNKEKEDLGGNINSYLF